MFASSTTSEIQCSPGLPKVFWPQALHGANNCSIADTYALALRRAAVKAIGAGGAGSNPMLRLILSDDMANDPGFYQLNHCISTWRRMLRKFPDLLPTWKVWAHTFSGKFFPGPFSKLLQCLSGIGWSLEEPPIVCDHEGHKWDLMNMDNKTLTTVLQDAWLQFVACQIKHQTMQGLHGIERSLTLLDTAQMSPLDKARLPALHSGAFISNAEHAKYDMEKFAICHICRLEDDREHWLICPRYQHIRQSIPGWFPDNVEQPRCVLNHLLVSKLEPLLHWRQMLYELLDETQNFYFEPPKQGLQHLFIDVLKLLRNCNLRLGR